METEQDQLDQEIAKLEQQLREAGAAGRFLESDVGRVWVELVSKKITKATREIASDKFIKDHTGYVNAVLELNCYKRILKEMQVACAPARVRKIKERLGQYEDEPKPGK